MGPPNIKKKNIPTRRRSAFSVVGKSGKVTKLQSVSVRVPRARIARSKKSTQGIDGESKRSSAASRLVPCTSPDILGIIGDLRRAKTGTNEQSEQTQTQLKEHESFRCLKLPTDKFKKLVFLKGVVPFFGLVKICVLKGSVMINGCSLDATTPFLTIASSFVTGISTIECTKGSTCSSAPPVSSSLETLLADQSRTFAEEATTLSDEYSTVCLVEEMRSSRAELSFLKRSALFAHILPSESQFFECTRCPFPYVSSKHWDASIVGIADLIEDDSQSICVTGGKDIGKSTFCRFLINTLLQRFPCVFYLECDVGQTEFTPPGVVSLCRVEAPLLGLAPYTHQQRPLDACFYGDITPRDHPEKYLSCINRVFQTYQSQYISQGPLIINTQGWIKGLGSVLLLDLLCILRPSNVVQLHPSSPYQQKNSLQLNPDVLRGHTSSLATCRSDASSVHDPSAGVINFIHINTGSIKNKRADDSAAVPTFNAVDQRASTLLAYIGRLYDEDVAGLSPDALDDWVPRPLTAFVPYCLRWSEVGLHIAHCEVSVDRCLLSFNASLVSLSSSAECQSALAKTTSFKKPLLLDHHPADAIHLGFGLVRNIDPCGQVLFVVSPEPLDAMRQVNLLVKGSVELPRDFVKDSTDAFLEETPYLSSTESFPKIRGSGARKPRFNLLRRSLDTTPRK